FLVYSLLQFLEGNVLTPFIVGGKVRLFPLTVMIAFIFWGTLWGIPGAVLAVPMTSAVKVVCEHLPPSAGLARLLAHPHLPAAPTSETAAGAAGRPPNPPRRAKSRPGSSRLSTRRRRERRGSRGSRRASSGPPGEPGSPEASGRRRRARRRRRRRTARCQVRG